MKGSWTAISRAPYLKALALWPWGDCWNGGGLFLTDSRFWRNAGYHSDEPNTVGRLGKKLTEESGYPFDDGYGGECPGVYYLRLQRDGWKLLRDESPSPEVSVTVFEKLLPKGWVLGSRRMRQSIRRSAAAATMTPTACSTRKAERSWITRSGNGLSWIGNAWSG